MTRLEKKWVTIAAALSSWAIGIAAAGAIAIALTRPLKLPAVAAFTTARTVELSTPADVVMESTTTAIDDGSYVLEPMWIFGTVEHNTPAAATRTPNVAPDIN